jgi:Ca-activated chloride channel family protein
MTMGSDLYSILGVPRDATPEEIRAAYFEAARQYHPDANPDPGARELFLAIQSAYEILSNPEKRASYDASLPEPTLQPKIAISIKYSRSVLPLLDEPQIAYGLVEMVCTTEPDPAQFPPLHVCLLIDRSTSMAGERMDMVKSNIIQFIRQLRPQDMVSIVTFSDRAEAIIPMSRMTDLPKIERKISMISPGGGTEIFRGLETGIMQLLGLRGVRAARQLILMTDGHTYGDEKACMALAERASTEGISINAMGIGNEWNDTFLDHLTSISGGSAFFITSSKDLFKFLDQKRAESTSVYARGVTLEFTAQSTSQLRYAFRLSPEAGPLEVKSPVVIGDLIYGRSLTFLLEFYIPNLARDIRQFSLIEGKLKMGIPSQRDEKSRLFLTLSRPCAPDPESELPPSAVMDALSHLSLYRLQERARQEVETGQIAQASRRLQYLATHLLSIGDRELAHTVLVEAEHLQQSRHFSKDGDKRIKYGTRSLLLPSGLEQDKL